MATYILAGGSDGSHPEYMKNIARVVSMKVARPRVLGVWFSGSEERANQRFPEFRDYILAYFPEGTTYERADRDQFIWQVKESDVIYLHGGSTDVLIPAMQSYSDIEQAFEGKVVIGSSAGAGYLSRYYWSPSRSEVGEGSSILDVAVVAHYGSEGYSEMSFASEFWEAAVGSVSRVSGGRGVLLLPEGTFAVIEK